MLLISIFTKIPPIPRLVKGGEREFFNSGKGGILASSFLALLFAWTLIGPCGCATFGERPHEVVKEDLFKEYLQKGRECEDKGDPVEALKQYKLAMTVDPANKEVIDGSNRVETALRSLAEKHYKAGLELDKAGKYARSRQQFLIALRLWSDYPEATNMLTTRKRIKIKRYVVHIVRSSENLSNLAKIYYGDPEKFSIIAKYNSFDDASRIAVGQKIKIPEIEGVDFLVGKEPVETESLPVDNSEIAEWDWEDYALEDRPEPVDQVAIYRNHGVDLFRKREYQMAIVEFSKVLNANPDDNIALAYAHKSHYQLAMDFYAKKDYLGARDQFKASLRYTKDCYDCNLYISKSEDLYKEMHYKEGIRFFDREQLNEAIKEWELVRFMDPDYKKVNELINKAKILLKKIEELKKSQKG
ncbi:MAG: LysM peptidoglycan-binding domain-containing protein [Desulfobulbaceae bacterium]|nr:LysM peptidoglycan-binding domain-containing protein [Desulfobulbaceae bacterium]